MRYFVAVLAVAIATSAFAADETTTFAPKPIRFDVKPYDSVWRRWTGIGHFRGRIRINSIVGNGNEIWIGTSQGKLLSLSNDAWTLQANLESSQITDIAFEGPNRIWLSTSDGIRRLDRQNDLWNMSTFRTYYQGDPKFVSGAYLPGDDSERLWGYVDHLYIPPKNRGYAPFIVSQEHGLFSFAPAHEISHHFMPHYWGASSPWLDTRELIPHRRPTCITEDVEGNLWIGTEGDGIVRLNAAGRDYYKRCSLDNAKDGKEFAFIGKQEVGRDFSTVAFLAPGKSCGVWAILGAKDRHAYLARFDGKTWTTMALANDRREVTCVAEIAPDLILVGSVRDNLSERAIFEIDWKTQAVKCVCKPNSVPFNIAVMPDGRIFAASRFEIYEKNPLAPTNSNTSPAISDGATKTKEEERLAP